MPQSFVSLPVHRVFSTKTREPLIRDEILTRLYKYMGGIFRTQKSILIASGGMPDHVHLLVLLDKQLALAELLREQNSAASQWIRDAFPRQRNFAWQAGYGAFAASNSNLPQATHYIANQAQYHHAQSYQDEFIALLKKHEIEFDALSVGTRRDVLKQRLCRPSRAMVFARNVTRASAVAKPRTQPRVSMPPHVPSPGRATVTRLAGDTFHAAVICQFAGASRI
ncbi:MAG: IS200/IS605 family transposase [Pirellulaceae bacterium]